MNGGCFGLSPARRVGVLERAAGGSKSFGYPTSSRRNPWYFEPHFTMLRVRIKTAVSLRLNHLCAIRQRWGTPTAGR